MSTPTKTRIPAPDGPTLPSDPAMGPGGISEWLGKFKVRRLLQPGFSLVVIDSQATWSQALDTLTKKNLLSAPVFDREHMHFIGLVDVIDLLAYAMRVISNVHMSPQELTQWAFQTLPVKLMRDVSLRNPWCPVYIDLPLSSLVDMFSTKVALHRVPLVDQDGRVVGLVSQSRLLEFCAEHLSDLHPFLRRSLSEVMASPVISVPAATRTRDAFEKLLSAKVSGLAVVDTDGRLVGQLSASDLKGAAMGDLISNLDLPLTDFLAQVSKRLEKRAAVLTAYADQTIGQAVAILGSSLHIHRLFVLDAEQRPIGVVSMADIIEVLSNR